jgi:hypothetical protein
MGHRENKDCPDTELVGNPNTMKPLFKNGDYLKLMYNVKSRKV